MQKEIELNDKYRLAVWYPGSGHQVSAFLVNKETGFRISPYHTIAFFDDLRTFDLIRVSDTKAQVKLNDQAVSLLVLESSITVA